MLRSFSSLRRRRPSPAAEHPAVAEAEELVRAMQLRDVVFLYMPQAMQTRYAARDLLGVICEIADDDPSASLTGELEQLRELRAEFARCCDAERAAEELDGPDAR